VTPELQIYDQNSKILTVLGAVFPHFCPNKREIWYGGEDLRGENPIFGLLSKNNTGMAALRAGLPLKTDELEKIEKRLRDT